MFKEKKAKLSKKIKYNRLWWLWYRQKDLTTEALTTKVELKAEGDKIVKAYDWSFFIENKFLVMLVFKICLLIIQHLVRYSWKRIKTSIMLLVENQNGKKSLSFLHNILFSCMSQDFLDIKWGWYLTTTI